MKETILPNGKNLQTYAGNISYDGKIILRNVVEGQTISTSDVLFALADELIVKASVDEADIGKAKIGQKR
jgi:multidrug resistance efflux pump